MTQCDEVRASLCLYIDGEMQAGELTNTEEHLRCCEVCRVLVDSERRFVAHVREVSPLYTAPKSLRESIQRLADDLATPNVA
ncbi:MAG: anti-sigma factor family protein [Blastocatellia bacterium]